MKIKQSKLGKKLLSLTIMLTMLLTIFVPPSYAAPDGVEGVYAIPADGNLVLPDSAIVALCNGTHTITEVSYSLNVKHLIYNNTTFPFFGLYLPKPGVLVINDKEINLFSSSYDPTAAKGVEYKYNEVSSLTDVQDYMGIRAINVLPEISFGKPLTIAASKSFVYNYKVRLRPYVFSGINSFRLNFIPGERENVGHTYHYVYGADWRANPPCVSGFRGYVQMSSISNIIQHPSATFLNGSYVKIERNTSNATIQVQDVVNQLPVTLNNAVTNINTSLSNQILGTIQIAINSPQRTAILSQYGLASTITANGVYPSSQGGRYRVVFYSPPTNIDQLNLS